MARGPQQVQPEVASRPLPGVFQSAPGGDFGQVQAQQTQQAAQNVARLAETADQAALRMSTQDDEARARELDTQFNAELRGLLYDPEKGYYSKRGKAAYDATVPTLKAIEDLRVQYLEQANGGQQRSMLARVLGSRADSAADGMSRHASVQRLAWLDAADAAVVADAKVSGATNAFDDKLRAQEYQRGRNGILDAAQRKGQPDEVTVVQLKAFESDFQGGVVRRFLSADDPIRARKYYDDNIKSFTGDDAIKLERELKDATTNRRAQQLSAVITATGGVSPNYTARVIGAEGGSPTVENKIGALGKYQMIPGTYTELAQATEWGKGKTQAEVRALLLDPQEGPARQDELQKGLQGKQTKALTDKGVPVNDLSLYVTHFLGTGAGPEILKLPDATPLQAGLIKAHGGDAAFVQKVNAANPFLAKVETVGDLKALLAQKIGAPATMAVTGSPEKPNLDAMLAQADALTGGDLDLKDKTFARVKSDYATKLTVYNAQRADLEKQALAHIDGGGTLENLPPQIKASLDTEGLGKVALYEERRVERRRKVISDDAQKDLTDLEMAGTLTPSDVDARRRVMTDTEYRSWQRRARGEDRIDNAERYDFLLSEVGQRNIREDIMRAHAEGDLSIASRNSLLEKNKQFLTAGGPAGAYKRGHDMIADALNPGALGSGPQEMIMRSKRAQAIGALDQYVMMNPQTEKESREAYDKRVMQFATDTVARNRPIAMSEMALALPVPAHTGFNRNDMTGLPNDAAKERLLATTKELRRRFEAGEINEEQFLSDADVLGSWLTFIEKRPEPTPVTPPRR